MRLDKKKFIELVGKLVIALKARDNVQCSPLFGRNAALRMGHCLGRMVSKCNEEDEFEEALNGFFFSILSTTNSVTVTGARDDPISLKTVYEIISEINRLGASGSFGRRGDRLTCLTNTIKETLRRRIEGLEIYIAAANQSQQP